MLTPRPLVLLKVGPTRTASPEKSGSRVNLAPLSFFQQRFFTSSSSKSLIPAPKITSSKSEKSSPRRAVFVKRNLSQERVEYFLKNVPQDFFKYRRDREWTKEDLMKIQETRERRQKHGGKLELVQADDEDGDLRLGDIEIPGEFEGYFLDPEGYKDDRLRKVENRLRHAKRPQKKSSLPSTYKVDPEGAPFTRRQLRVKAKIMPELIAQKQVLDNLLEKHIGQPFTPGMFTIEDIVMSRDLRVAEVHWDSVENRSEIRQFLQENNARIRYLLTQRIQPHKLSPELRWKHISDVQPGIDRVEPDEYTFLLKHIKEELYLRERLRKLEAEEEAGEKREATTPAGKQDIYAEQTTDRQDAAKEEAQRLQPQAAPPSSSRLPQAPPRVVDKDKLAMLRAELHRIREAKAERERIMKEAAEKMRRIEEQQQLLKSQADSAPPGGKLNRIRRTTDNEWRY